MGHGALTMGIGGMDLWTVGHVALTMGLGV